MVSKFNNYLSQEEKDIIISMYNEGYNTVVIANKLNRHNSSIGRFLKKQGLRMICLGIILGVFSMVMEQYIISKNICILGFMVHTNW